MNFILKMRIWARRQFEKKKQKKKTKTLLSQRKRITDKGMGWSFVDYFDKKIAEFVIRKQFYYYLK